jgi:molybdopterin-guanine dinucleotide biosynthesis protein A
VHALTAVILAGGAGTRVGGRDKGLIEHEGLPLVEHVRRRLAPQVSRIWISANRNLEGYAQYGERVLADEREAYDGPRQGELLGKTERGVHAGPLAGIATALAACESEFLLTVPVDSLEFPEDLATRLLEAMDSQEVSIAVAHDGERRQPLFALYRRELAPAARGAARSEDNGVWRFQDRHGAREVAFADARFENLNTLSVGDHT